MLRLTTIVESLAKLNQPEKESADYKKAIESKLNLAENYTAIGIKYSEIGKYVESARNLRKGGVLFLKLRREAAAKSFDLCFNLRDKIENDDVIYCGLANYFLSLDWSVIIGIRKMQAEDEVLNEILNLTLRKLNGEDISEEINKMEYKEERDEMKMLLDMLKLF